MAQIIWEGDTGQTFNIAIDASIEETHESPTTITDHAVESGANISDHMRPDADRLTIEGIISNTPIVLPKDHVDGAREVDVQVEGVAPGVRIPLPIAGSLIGNIPIAPTPKGTVKGFDPAFDRVAAVYKELLKIRAEGRLVRVLTSLRQYDDMGIENISIPRNASLGHALRFTIRFKQVFLGSTEKVPVPVIPREKVDKGSKTTTPAPEGIEDRTSFLFNAFGD